jgi:hypothetical protein
MRLGTAIYPTVDPVQFPLEGINTQNPAFTDAQGAVIEPQAVLLSGDLWISRGSPINGRLNQAGIGLLPPVSSWQGYTRCVTIESGDQISVALSATRAFRLYVNGDLAIQYWPIYPVRASDYLHIIPLALSVGKHNLTFEGLSESTVNDCFDRNGYLVQCTSASAASVEGGCLGSFVCEVYLNVTPEILSQTKDQDGLNSLYAMHMANGIGENITTIGLKGSPTDTGVNGNYSCAGGYLDNCEEGAFYCKDILTAAKEPCCFTLTNCVTGAEIITNTDLTIYLPEVIRINEQEGCFLISVNADANCVGAIPVTIDSSYVNCLDCTAICYRLTDCEGNVEHLHTLTDLSAYVSKVIKIDGYNVCWIVSIVPIHGVLMTPTISDLFNNCEECL